ncbi:MAG: hypothetical protein IJ007_03950 [Oscillospiraceae bacterium]|nr:hypothetical protein [Oscillospiraceae bacterium]
MGLFDKLFKRNKAEDEEPEIFTTPDKILNSASTPVLPLFGVEEETGEKVYSFKISEDFTVYETRMYPAFQYYPYTDDGYEDFDGVLPVIAIGRNARIEEACRQLENDEVVTELLITKVQNEYFPFRTEFEDRGKVIYAYAFGSYTAREWEAFMLTYNPDIKGTALEQKLKAALDTVIRTYTERDKDE